MPLETPTIVHTYKYGFGGIGDLFRSLIGFHAACQQAGVAFHISLDETPDFKECFELAPIPSFDETPSEYRQHIADHRGNHFIQQALHYAQEKKAIQTVASNSSLLHNPTLIATHTPTLSSLIRPSARTLAKIDEMYSRYSLTRRAYASFHLRCGDVYMCRESGKGSSPDIRTSLTPENIDIYARILCQFSERLGGTTPILIHSDSNQFKGLLREKMAGRPGLFIFLDMPIQHVANRLGDNTVDSYVSTVAEFFMLVNSAAICMPNYSGFSHIASVLGDVPIYGPLRPNREHRELLESLGPSKKYPC